MYDGGKIFFDILGDARGSDQIRQSQSAKVGDNTDSWQESNSTPALKQVTSLIRGSPEAIVTMGSPQWQGWAAVHSVNGFKDYSRALSTVYVSHCHKNTDGGLHIVDLATHIAKYQPVLTELQNETVPEFSRNAGGSGENCGSQSELNHNAF